MEKHKEYFINKKDEMVESLRRLLKYNSVASEAKEGAPNGEAVNDCLNEALEMAKEMGFKVGNIEGYAGYAEAGEGKDYVAVLGHLDIVPAGSGWSFDPFKGEIKEGKIYGRGTNDDKGPMVAALYGLKALVDEGEKLGSRVRIIFGTSEETGGPDIEKYLEKEDQPKAGFTPDAAFPAINGEKGIINVKICKKLNTGDIDLVQLQGGEASNMVADKAFVSFKRGKGKEAEKIEVSGISAHGSTPEKGENALIKLFKEMAKLNGELKREMEVLLTLLEDTKGRGLGVDLFDIPSGHLSMNLGTGLLKEGKLELVLNFRLPVTFNKEDLLDPISNTLKENDFEIYPGEFTSPLYYEKDKPLVKTLMEVYREYTGDSNSQAQSIGGGTYAKTMANIVAFGPSLPGREDVDHIKDEYIFLDDFILWAAIYREAIKRLTFTGGN